jgi:hypothetical protein
MGLPVNVDIFVRAEAARIFDGSSPQPGGVNARTHMRGAVPLDRQTVTRMNRDTLYPSAAAGCRRCRSRSDPGVQEREVA